MVRYKQDNASYEHSTAAISVSKPSGKLAYSSPDQVGFTTTTTPDPDDVGYCDSLGQKSKSREEGEFAWNKELQGLLLGSFFWGYLFLQIPGGVLSEKYGPRRVIFFTMLPVGLLGLVSPVSARVSPWLFLVIRILIGVGEGALYSATHALWGRWSPPSERSRLVGMSFSGGQFGNAMIFPIGGLLCSTLGWDSIFYIMGGFCTLWCFVFWFLVSDSPSLNRRISKLERGYIQYHVSYKDNRRKPAVPWRKILTCVPFWAILVAHTCGNYGLYMLLTQIPTYMKEVLKFDLKSNGAYSMLPYLFMWAFIALTSVVSDAVIARNILSRTATRKITSCTGLFLPAVCLVSISFLDCTQSMAAVALLCGTVGMSGVAFSGYMVNHGDIAPLFAGTMFGVTNVAATVPGIIAPYVVGAITPNKTREEWQVAFFIASGIYVFGGLFYLIFAKGTEEEWAKPESQDNSPGSRSMIEMGKGCDREKA
ncbi:hypothetical protein PoB_000249200 [Plakobranchus ocellatus]|uniref:Major facilitator superfamily (MFS) profile domain-containing protein n=1 Tax=Plakobranchus ocellatus TaxID=259542 RepID=A0AAV3Y0M7_9GAST|nr:hypothetical protein PoB_000249200 [Plakobranchus ocellatus]